LYINLFFFFFFSVDFLAYWEMLKTSTIGSLKQDLRVADKETGNNLSRSQGRTASSYNKCQEKEEG